MNDLKKTDIAVIMYTGGDIGTPKGQKFNYDEEYIEIENLLFIRIR